MNVLCQKWPRGSLHYFTQLATLSLEFSHMWMVSNYILMYSIELEYIKLIKKAWFHSSNFNCLIVWLFQDLHFVDYIFLRFNNLKELVLKLINMRDVYLLGINPLIEAFPYLQKLQIEVCLSLFFNPIFMLFIVNTLPFSINIT